MKYGQTATNEQTSLFSCAEQPSKPKCSSIPVFGYPFNAGHAAPSMTCREGLTTLPGHGQFADL